METKEIVLESIKVSDLNTRKDLEAGTEDASIDDLATSIQEHGLISPVTVVARSDGYYDLIAGQRRFLACKKIGMATISAIIRDDLDTTDATVISLVENVHRADMSPIDKARAFEKIHSRYGEFKRVAQETGVSVSTVRRYMSLLDLAPSIQEGLSTSGGPAGIGTLSKLAATFPADEQKSVLEQIGGFNQKVQSEILKRSGGNSGIVQELREQALEGAFDIRSCSEGFCFEMSEDLKSFLRRLLDEERELDQDILPDIREVARNSRLPRGRREESRRL